MTIYEVRIYKASFALGALGRSRGKPGLSTGKTCFLVVMNRPPSNCSELSEAQKVRREGQPEVGTEVGGAPAFVVTIIVICAHSAH